MKMCILGRPCPSDGKIKKVGGGVKKNIPYLRKKLLRKMTAEW